MKRLVLIILCVLATSPAYATIRMVTKTGANTGNCSVNPCLTIAYAATQMAAADILTIGTGTYNEGLVYNEFPDGTDAAHQTVIGAATGATVVINGAEPNGFTAAISGHYKAFTGPGLTIDGVNATNGVGIYFWGTAPASANHITVQYVEVKGVTGGTSACVTAGGDGTDVHHLTLANLHVHGCHGGVPTTHCIYAHFTDSTIEDSEINDCSGDGIQQYSSVVAALSSNTFRRLYIHGVAQDGTSYAGIYAGGTNSDNTRIYNNILANGGGPGSGVIISGTLSLLLYNNTITGFAAAGGISGCAREETSGTNLGSLGKNNICWLNTPLNTFVGTAWTQASNICGSGCSSSSDPLLVSVGTTNCQVSVGSPAIANGADLSATFTDSYNGVTRSAPFDIGACKYVSASVAPPLALTTLGAGAN